MAITVGSTGQIIQVGKGDVIPFTVREMYECSGKYVIYVERHARTIHVPATLGLVNVPPSDAAFPLFINEHESQIIKFMQAIKSQPVALVIGGHQLPGVNMDRLPGFWDGARKADQAANKAHLLEHARKMIKLWDEWRTNSDQLPAWFRQLQVRFDLTNRNKPSIETPFRGMDGLGNRNGRAS